VQKADGCPTEYRHLSINERIKEGTKELIIPMKPLFSFAKKLKNNKVPG